METLNDAAIYMELKYCERCGTLWLRLQGSDVLFCPSCTTVLAGVARDPRFRMHKNKATRCSATQPLFENTAWSEGGNA